MYKNVNDLLRKSYIFYTKFRPVEIDSGSACVSTNLEIPNVTTSDIEFVFFFLYSQKINSIPCQIKQPISTFSNILRIMTIIGIDDNITNYYITETIKNNDNFLFELIDEINYEDYFMLIIKSYDKVCHIPYIKSIATILKNKNYPDKFRLEILTKLIIKCYLIKDFDYILAVTYEYVNLTKNVNEILTRVGDKYYFSFGKIICSVYKDFLESNVIFNPYSQNLKITCLFINNEEIELIVENTITHGTIGSNVLKTIANHVAQILLGIKELAIIVSN